jgi:esterase/lipase superfamily enzyme
MHSEHHYWYTNRLERDMGVRVFGHYGYPILVFPTSMGNEWEYEGFGMIDAMAPFIDAGRVKMFCISAVTGDSWNNKAAHPSFRSLLQARYDDYVASEVFPFIRNHCNDHNIPITTSGSSLGGYHALNTLLKHPEAVRRCLAMSGVYDLRRMMDGHFDDNFYFNNPVDYMSNMWDERALSQIRGCDIHLATGSGPWEDSGPSYRMAQILRDKGVSCSLDDFGQMGGHDWPYWKHMMGIYLNNLF